MWMTHVWEVRFASYIIEIIISTDRVYTDSFWKMRLNAIHYRLAAIKAALLL